MAARRQSPSAATAAASPAGLKIKVKTGVRAAKANKEGHPQESGDDVGAEPGDGAGTNEGMLKRKRPTPPGSPVPSKKPPRGDSLSPLTANGEPAETVPRKSESNLTDLNVVKQRNASVGAETLTESVEVGADRISEEGNKATSNSLGELQVSAVATEDQHRYPSAGQKGEVDLLRVGEQLKTAIAGFQASSSLATSSPRTVEDTERHHTIPSHAGWFSWTEIHTLEKRGLPEFFNGKDPGKTSESYMEYRNTIMRKYREDLGKVIAAADMQEQLSGVDEKSIYRIMEFLDHWGLINYQAPAELLPSWKNPAPIWEADAALMLRALPRKGSSLYHFDTTSPPAPKQNLVNPKTTDAVIADMLAFAEGPEVEYHCNSCAADCSKQRYHCQKQADFDLCPDCYTEGKFGPDMVSTDFMKMDVTEAFNANGGGWTDQETLLLLEALELYGDNWNEIAEHVATKSKSQCILHFIRLPVEDPFLEDTDVLGSSNNVPSTTPPLQIDSTPQGEAKGEEIADKEPENSSENVSNTNIGLKSSSGDLVLPPNLVAFADAGNPVMAQVAFLGTMVGSEMAAVSAKVALRALTMKDPGIHLAAGTAMILDDPVVEVQPSSSEHPDRLVQVDEEFQSGDQTTQPGDADPCSTEIGRGDSTASAQNDDDVHRPLDSNLGVAPAGKEVVQKTDAGETLNTMEESKAAGRVKRAAASAMAAAALKSKLLADQEEREMQRLIAIVVEQQLKKLELKLKLFSELDTALAKECDSVERDRLDFFADYARLAASRLGTSSTSNEPTSPQQQPASPPRQQPAAIPQGHAPFMYGPGFQVTHQNQVASSNHQMANQTAFAQSPMFQALANQMHAGALARPQGHFGRQMFIGGTTPPHLLGRSAVPQEVTPHVLGRSLIPSDPPSQGLVRAFTAITGLSRSMPGDAMGGVPQ